MSSAISAGSSAFPTSSRVNPNLDFIESPDVKISLAWASLIDIATFEVVWFAGIEIA